MKNLLIVFFVFINNLLLSQIKLLDIETNECIINVDIYNKDLNYIGSTNSSNEISKLLINNILLYKDYIVLKSTFYEDKKINIGELLSINKIFLTKKVYNLEEVVVSNKKIKNKIKITGYYRSTQLNNNKIHLFNDGIVEYYIDLKKNKVSPLLKTNRIFENKEIKQLSNKIHFSVVGCPNIYNNEFKKAKDIKIENKSQLIEKRIIFNDSTKVSNYGFLGHESILSDYSVIIVYKDSINIENLLYHKELRKYKIKTRKDKIYTDIESIHEFFVTNIQFIEDLEKPNCRLYVFNKGKLYDKAFWQNIDNIIFKDNTFYKQKFDDTFEEINEYLE